MALDIGNDARDVNRAWIMNDLESRGVTWDAAAPATLNGAAITAGEAMELALDRMDANNVNLGVQMVGGTGASAGDMFLLSIYYGSCAAQTGAANPAYPGAGYEYIGQSQTGGATLILDRAGILPPDVGGPTAYAGSTDFWCIEFWGIVFDLPYVLGAAAPAE